MNAVHFPARSEFHRLAGNGNLVPVYREIMADADTPVSAFAALGRNPYSFLLESVVGGEKWAAYSFIGVKPRAVITCRGDEFSVEYFEVPGENTPATRTWQTADPTEALRDLLAYYRPTPLEGLPRFWGGAVGWIGYDAVRWFEKLPQSAPAESGALPELAMVLTDTLVIFDNFRQTVKVVGTACIPAGATRETLDGLYDSTIARVEEVVSVLQAPRQPLRQLAPPHGLDGLADRPISRFGRAAYLAAVERVREYIAAGDVFQTVLSQRFEMPREDVDAFDVYRALRVLNPSPYMFHLEFPDAVVTGASPETLVRCADGRVEVRPIAGTRKRGANAVEDDALADELLSDEKECAEHLMLIDLGRNDVGRVSTLGSVEVSECMGIERYSHVMHMVSHVQGELREGCNWRDALRAAFPAGTLSGAPKIRAMEIIEELEPHRRGIYGGAVGYICYAGTMDLAIAIRTLVMTRDRISVQAGAGLVYDSDPAAEYDECVNKASAVLRAVQSVRG